MSSGPATKLVIRGIEKSYDSHHVLRGVDLEAYAGEVLGILGANGVGKSTLAAIVAGITTADQGSVTLDDSPLLASQVCFIEQNPVIDPWLTVTELLFQGSALSDEQDQLRDARTLLTKTGIPVLPTDRVGDLPDIERRMLEIARIKAEARAVVVIDEVSNSLNAREVEDLRQALVEARQENQCVIYITHRLDEALQLCDRIAVLREGTTFDVYRSLTTTQDQLTEAMFGFVVSPGQRPKRAQADLLMSVRGLQTTRESLSFDLRKGEVLGICGARGSGIDEIIGALTGETPATVESWELDGTPISIRSQLDPIRWQIAVLPAPSNPAAESYFARNLLLLEDDETDLEASFESTAEILLAIRKSEMAGEALLGRPPLSGGQRRWAQLREIAADNAQLLVLIEPTVGLDVHTQEQFSALLNELTTRGGSAILVSSDERELHQLSDRILVVANGGIRAQWDTFDIEIEDLRAVTKGEWPLVEMPNIAALADEGIVT